MASERRWYILLSNDSGIQVIAFVFLLLQLKRQNSLGEKIVEWAVINDQRQVCTTQSHILVWSGESGSHSVSVIESLKLIEPTLYVA